MRAVAKWLGGALAFLLALAIVAIVLPPPAAPLPAPGTRYRIDNVRIVDVESGTTGAPTSVTLRDGRIAAIGARAAAPGQVVIDGRGRFLVPGFWDMHVHSFQLSPQLHFPLFVANGVTNARDMMDCPGADDSLIACVVDKRRWTREIDAGRLAAPRIVELASYYLERPDTTPAQASALVDAYAARGVDAIKVYNRLPVAAYRAAAVATQRHRLRLVGHLPHQVALDEAVAAGQLSFEHAHVLVRHCSTDAAAWRAGRLAGLPPVEQAERMVASHDPTACARTFAALRSAGAWLVPTHVTREEDARAADPRFVNDPRLAYLDPLSRWAFRDDLAGTANRYPGAPGGAALRAYFAHGRRLTGAAFRAGVPVLVGTDTAIGGFRYHDELAHLAAAGLTPAEVLRAATIDAARYARQARTAGSIAVGKRADLILLAANPLLDIANTRRIEEVYLAGRRYDRAGLDRLLAFNHAQAAAPANWVRLLWGFLRSSVAGDL